MESIYAALLLHKVGGKITEANIEKVLKAAGAEVDKDSLTKLVAGLKGTDIDNIIKSAAPVMTATAATEQTPKVAKKEEEEEEKEEEPTGIGSLF
ncbi:MAG: 50S ribosomal protein L12 [Candidatus Hodarchaeota archaeon]